MPVPEWVEWLNQSCEVQCASYTRRYSTLAPETVLIAVRLSAASGTLAPAEDEPVCGDYLAIVTYHSSAQEWVLYRLFILAPATADVAYALPSAAFMGLMECVNRALTTVEEGDTYLFALTLPNVESVPIDTPEEVGCVPPVIDVSREYLLFQTPTGRYQVWDSLVSRAAAAHYASLGWRLLRATIHRDFNGFFSLAFLTGLGCIPSHAEIPEVLATMSRYLERHSWGPCWEEKHEAYFEQYQWPCPTCMGQLGHLIHDDFFPEGVSGFEINPLRSSPIPGRSRLELAFLRCPHCGQESATVIASFLDLDTSDAQAAELLPMTHHRRQLRRLARCYLHDILQVSSVKWWHEQFTFEDYPGGLDTYLSECRPLERTPKGLAAAQAWAQGVADTLWPR